MITIRKGVFETNSSSSHSIVMLKQDHPTERKNGKIDGGWRCDDGELLFFYYDLEFGRSPFDLLTDWYGRLRYAIASYSNDDAKINEIEDICANNIEGFEGFIWPKDYNNEITRGCVDHQSDGVLQQFLAKTDTSLEEFIFNDRYIVVIDGDEYNVFDTFMKTDMFNKDSIETINGE